MKREEARQLATREMAAHGLDGWTFRFDRAKRRAGSCVHRTRTITLSGPLVELYEERDVRGVILHEIAHALVGPAHQHDSVWKRKARELGVPDSARLGGNLPRASAPWVGKCPRCGATRELFSAPRRVVSCGSCSTEFCTDLLLRWSHEGRPTVPTGRYEREFWKLMRSEGLRDSAGRP